MSRLQYIYDNSPHFFQSLLLNLYSFHIHRERYGKQFNLAFNNLKKTQWFSTDQIYSYQFEQFKLLLTHAYCTVPFYRNLYDKYGVKPEDIKELSDISLLPIITREDVRKAGNKMISSRFSKKNLVHGHTSGTTGSPLSFYWDKQTCIFNNAVDWRQKLWAGVLYGEKLALLLGRTVVATDRTKPPFWQHDRIHNMLWMSSFHLSKKYLPIYIEKLRTYQPTAIEGYPSTIYILARYLKSIGESLPVKAIFTSSETLLPMQRSLIEAQFQAPVFDFYGQAERTAFATQCAEAHEYHLNFEYAVNEVIDLAGKSVEGEGYLVGTSLLNYGMPFIRYRSSDITAIKEGKCICGRYMPRFKSVTTKDEDIIVTPEGKLVASSVLTHPFKPLDSVIESQIIQHSIDQIIIKIVCRKDYSESDSIRLVNALRERVGPSMSIKLDFVDSIPRTKAGKYRWVVSKVPLPL